MARTLSSIANNLSERIHRIKYKYELNISLGEYTNFKTNSIEYKCLWCNKIIKTSLIKS